MCLSNNALDEALVTVLHDPELSRVSPPRWPALTAPEENPFHSALIALFERMNLDRERIGTPAWNPLSDVIEPGQTVVIKPNLVHHRHYTGGELHWLITDPRLIRAVCDWAVRATGLSGEVIIGDAPLQSANFPSIARQSGLDELPSVYARQGYWVTLSDFRRFASEDWRGLKRKPRTLDGDPNGYAAVDLGKDSLHAGRDYNRLRVTNYDPAEMLSHHNEFRHEYLISGSILKSHVVLNLPKLKTHRKAGLTCAMKNMVGVNGSKDWLPHHSAGGTDSGGDDYSGKAAWKDAISWMSDQENTASPAAQLGWNLVRKVVWKAGKAIDADHSWEGSWHGNDTLWRTIVDLNRAVRYAARDGHLCETPQRKVFTIVDASIAGDREGPMAPHPVEMNCLLAGSNVVFTEIAATLLAGWPPDRLRYITGAAALDRFQLTGRKLEDLSIDACGRSGGRTVPGTWQQFVRPLQPSKGFLSIPVGHGREVACG